MHRREWGVTLVEVMIVLAVVMIVASVLLPVISTRETSRRATCQSNLAQLCRASLAYAQDYDERLPAPIVDGYGWDTAIDTFVLASGDFVCPSDPVGPLSYGANSGTTGATSPWANRLTAVRSPATKILIGEYHDRMAGSGPTIAWPGVGTFDAHMGRAGSNYGFCDGHVEFRNRESVTQSSSAWNAAD